MGSSASVWVLKVAIFLGAIPRRRCAEGHWGNPRYRAAALTRALDEPKLCPGRGARASSQVSARGRNRVAEFTGEFSARTAQHPSGHITRFILRPFASSGRAYRRGRDVPPAAKGDSSRSARPGFNAARMFPSAALATH